MKCEEVIERFLGQEDGRYPAFFIRLHIVFCSRCRNEIRALQSIFIKAATSSSYTMPYDATGEVMRSIFKSAIIYEKNISSVKWLFTGAVIFASIFLVSYSESFIWLRSHFGSGLEIPVYIVLGLIITFYSAMCIGSHMDGLKKFIKFIENRIH